MNRPQVLIVEKGDDPWAQCYYCQRYCDKTSIATVFGAYSGGTLVKSSVVSEHTYICFECSNILIQKLQDIWTDKLLGLGG